MTAASLAQSAGARIWGRRYDVVYARAGPARSGDNFAARLGATGYRRLKEARADAAFLAGAPALSQTPWLLDLGCGRGGYGAWLARRVGAELIGLDPSLVALAQAKSGLRCGGAFLAADAGAMPLAAASVGAAHSLDVLHCLDRPAAAFGEIARILAPGGRAVVVGLATARAGAADPIEIWRRAAQAAGFAHAALADETAAWRAHMRRRHGQRLTDAATAAADRAVSAAMLGGVINATRRAVFRLKR